MGQHILLAGIRLCRQIQEMFFVVLFFQGFIAASYGQGCEEPKILNSTSYGCPGGPEENSNSWCQVFLASNILTLDTDFRSGNDANYWLTEDRKTGGEQGFIMDLGCEKTVQGVSLRNVRNYHHHDRSTKKFRLLGTTNNNESWKEFIVADVNATSFVTIGGGVQENSIVMYNTVTGSWSTPWPKLAYGRRNHCCVRIHSNIVVAGGYHYGENKNTATTLIIDINTGRASDGPSMKEARSFFSMRGYGYESDNGVLVAIGGNVPQTQINNDYDDYDEYFDYYENDKDHTTSGFSNTVEAVNGSLSDLNSWTYIEEFKLSTGTGHFDTVVVKKA